MPEGDPAANRVPTPSKAPAAEQVPMLPPDPLAFLLLEATVVTTLAVVVMTSHGTAGRGAAAVAFWALLCAVSNVLPVPAVRNVYLGMSGPVNVAIATLFPHGTAALIVVVAALSEWELRRETTPAHALYNRAQLALATAAAGAAYAVAGGRPTALASLSAVVAYQTVNWGLVGGAEATCRRVPFRRVLRGLLPPQPVAAVSYFVLGLMGVALAATYERVGVWAVVLLLLPLLGARQAVAAFGALERSEHAQRALADRLIDERERERVRIAAEIHDTVLQELAALRIAADNVLWAVTANRPAVTARLAADLGDGADRAVQSLRQSIASLRRTAMDAKGLAPTLARYVRSFAAQSGIDVRLDTHDATGLPLPVAMLLYECAVESLTNVARHADARVAAVAVRRVGRAVELHVVDDGTGPKNAPGAGLGLLREKVELAGGRISVSRRRRGGTEVSVRVPVGRT